MEQYSTEIENTLKSSLEQHSPTVSFDSVWDKHAAGKVRKHGNKRIAAIPMVIVFTFIAVFTVAFAAYGVTRVFDNIDYPFVDDPQLIGKWEAVDFVQNADSFKPGQKEYGDELYLKELAFTKNGGVLDSIKGGNGALCYDSHSTWTKGILIDKQEKTASKYDLKQIDGETYMFVEWKSGDYVFDGKKPQYYVLKKVDSQDYSGVKNTPVVEDKTDYPFVNDPEMLGSWKSVDFVKNIADFQPDKKSCRGDLYLLGFKMLDDGKLVSTSTSGEYSSPNITWTKGMILDKNDKTASKCEIKEIDGSTYMFFEWKSGDYIYRGMKPEYYVLRKAE